jgi:hypothetical protein
MQGERTRIHPYERERGDTLGDAIFPFPLLVPPPPRERDLLPALRRRVHRCIAIERWPEALAIAVLALALVLLIGKAVGVAQYEAAILRYPFQRDDAEGVILAEATMIAHGANPYAYQPSPAHYFYAGPYTPLYTGINAAVVWLAGPTFAGGRAVQLLATLAVASWIAWAIGRSARGRVAWLVGIWAALLFLTWHLVAHWGAMVRPDMTALACELAGAAVLRRWWEEPEREGWCGAAWPCGRALGLLALGAGCFALGWWAKQTYVAVPLACTLCLLPYRPKVAITLAGLYGALVASSVGILTLLTAGGFTQKTYFYQASWTWQAYLFLARPFAHRYGLLPALALIAAVGLCVRQRRLTFGACWLALAALKTLSAGTDGGNHNHFIDLLAASTLVAGRGLAALVAPAIWQSGATDKRDAPSPAPTRRAMRLRLVGLAAILLLTGVAASEREGQRGWLAWEYRLPSAAERQGFAQAASRIESVSGPVYGDNVGLGVLALTGHAVQVTDPFTLAAEVRLGRWDDSAVVADVAAGRYRLIALRGDVMKMDPTHPPGDLTPGLIRAIRQRYHPVEHGVVWVYAPNG